MAGGGDGVSDAKKDELREEKKQPCNGKEEKRVAEVGDAMGSLSGRGVGRVVHGRLENGFAVGKDVANGRNGGHGGNVLLTGLEVIHYLGSGEKGSDTLHGVYLSLKVCAEHPAEGPDGVPGSLISGTLVSEFGMSKSRVYEAESHFETFFVSVFGAGFLSVDFFGALADADFVRSAGFELLAFATPVFFSGAMNLSLGLFLRSGAAAMFKGWGPAWRAPLRPAKPLSCAV